VLREGPICLADQEVVATICPGERDAQSAKAGSETIPLMPTHRAHAGVPVLVPGQRAPANPIQASSSAIASSGDARFLEATGDTGRAADGIFMPKIFSDPEAIAEDIIGDVGTRTRLPRAGKESLVRSRIG
jgi:hypothetical protein